MSNPQRAAVLVVALVALVAAFFALRPGEEEEPTTADTAPVTTAAPATTPAPPSTTGGTPAITTTTQSAPPPRSTVVRVRGGRPAGGVEEIRVTRGERVRLEVTSPDTSDEVHVHGYDLREDLRAGGRVRFSFEADAEGIFEVELEGAHIPIARLVVRPA